MKISSPNGAHMAEMLLRVAIGIFMFLAGVGKFMMGYADFVTTMAAGFEATFLPMALVKIFLYIVPVAEVVLGVWLLSGMCRIWALLKTGGLLVIFVFGLMISGQMDMVGGIFTYLLIIAFTMTLPSCCEKNEK